MPEIRVQHIVSTSSEDKNYPAENLIKGNVFKKWKCAAGEKSAILTLQFEKDSEIAQIDIGNEGSAFVEVLVGKSTTKDEEYQVILVASSFMNPVDSRNAQNLNKVRIFGPDMLSKTVCSQKWNRVKVVCTQPFNKNIQYGLSFIKFHSTPSATSNISLSAIPAEATSGTDTKNSFGAFTLKDDRAAGDLIKKGSVFEKNKQKSESLPLSGAAAIRAASRVADQSADAAASTTASAVSQSHQPIVSTDQSTASKVNKGAPSDRPSASSESNTSRQTGTDVRKEDKSKVNQSSSKAQPPPTKRRRASIHDEVTVKPLNRLMSGVKFVISGVENPLRGQLREKAQEMGAVYKPDWEKGCTHLICAYENTPKYLQVKGKGRIVTKDWITDCYRQTKLYPWRRYRLGNAPSPDVTESSSSDSESDTRHRNKPTASRTTGNSSKVTSAESNPASTTTTASSKASTTPGATGNKVEGKAARQMIDSDDRKRKQTDAADVDPFEASTDSEAGDDQLPKKESKVDHELKSLASDATLPLDIDPLDFADDQSDQPLASTSNQSNKADLKTALSDLPDFFSGKFFFLYGKFEASERRTLRRYITAYDGTVVEYMEKKVNFVISSEDWDENFDQALTENAELAFVRPAWIRACNDRQTLVPRQKYLISPS